jgi:hypothetical protein
MAVKLYRCGGQWVKIKAHPCWKVEKALMDMGVEYERVPGDRAAVEAGTGQRKFPSIKFDDGSWYREDSKHMERTIREGKLMDRAGGGTAPEMSG